MYPKLFSPGVETGAEVFLHWGSATPHPHGPLEAGRILGPQPPQSRSGEDGGPSVPGSSCTAQLPCAQSWAGGRCRANILRVQRPSVPLTGKPAGPLVQSPGLLVLLKPWTFQAGLEALHSLRCPTASPRTVPRGPDHTSGGITSLPAPNPWCSGDKSTSNSDAPAAPLPASRPGPVPFQILSPIVSSLSLCKHLPPTLVGLGLG